MQKLAAETDEGATVVALIGGAVPERADEIAELWAKYAPSVEVVPSRQGTTMEAEKEKIRFDLKTIEAFWLVGFSAWRSIETYSPAVVLGSSAQVTVDQFLSHDPANSYFWTFTAGLLIGLMRQAHRPMDFIPRSPRHIVEELLSRLG
jgi:hypothetical protein